MSDDNPIVDEYYRDKLPMLESRQGLSRRRSLQKKHMMPLFENFRDNMIRSLNQIHALGKSGMIETLLLIQNPVSLDPRYK